MPDNTGKMWICSHLIVHQLPSVEFSFLSHLIKKKKNTLDQYFPFRSCPKGVSPAGNQRHRLHPGHPDPSHQSGQRDGAEGPDQRAGTSHCTPRQKVAASHSSSL